MQESLGQLLTEERKKRGLTRQIVGNEVKINAKRLFELEHGYVAGGLRSHEIEAFASFYGLSKERLVKASEYELELRKKRRQRHKELKNES